MNNLRAALVVFAALAAVACTTTTTTKPAVEEPADEKEPVEKTTKSETTDAGAGAVCGGFGFADTKCGQCGESQCCGKAEACMADASCKSLTECVVACGESSSCTQGCVNKYSAGVALLQSLLNCMDGKCTAQCGGGSSGLGIGEKCTSSSQCESGSCTGTSSSDPGWCNDTCYSNADCGINAYGHLNYCLETEGGGDYCFPGCSSNADCTKYGPGITCQNAGSGRYVCSS